LEQVFTHVKALGQRLYHNWAHAWLHLAKALYSNKACSLGLYTTQRKGSTFGVYIRKFLDEIYSWVPKRSHHTDPPYNEHFTQNASLAYETSTLQYIYYYYYYYY